VRQVPEIFCRAFTIREFLSTWLLSQLSVKSLEKRRTSAFSVPRRADDLGV
jgi:hypothetical protein